MSSASETIEQLRAVTERKYQYGFVTDIEEDRAPKGLSEDIIRFISAKKDEPDWLLEWRLKAYRHWLTMERADLGARQVPGDRLPGRLLLLRAEGEGRRPEKPRRGRSGALEDIREARHSAARAGDARRRGRSTRCSTAFPSRPPSRASSKSRASSSARFSEAVQKHPELVRKYLGSVVPYTDNFFAALNSAVFTDGSFCLHAEGRALPDGAVDLFPHQRGEHRPVRAHADHRRGRRLRELSRRLHRADARREPAPCRGGRAGRAGRRADQVLDRAELVSGRREGQGRHLQFRDQARRVPRRAIPRSPGRRSRPARRSPGNIRAASCRATIRRASFIPSPSRTTTSRPTPARR